MWNLKINLFHFHFSIILCKSIHVVIKNKSSFFFMAEQYSIVCVCARTPHFVYPFISCGYLCNFQTLTVLNNARNFEVHASFQLSVFVFFGYIPYVAIWQFCFQYFEKPSFCFPQGLHQFTFPPVVYEGSLFCTSCQRL